MNRRDILRQGLAMISAPYLLSNGWAATTANVNRKKMIVIMLRGAVDGLNIIVPYADENYYPARPNISLSKPDAGKDDSVIDLNGYFGINPVLAPLMPLWNNKDIAFIHATGSPSQSRSHFEAQDYMETGTPDVKATQTGWLNRLLAELSIDNSTSLEGISVSNTIPRIFTGKHPITVIAPGQFIKTSSAISKNLYRNLFDDLYTGHNSLDNAYQSAQAADKSIQETLDSQQSEPAMAANGGQSVKGFTADARQLALLMRNRSDINFAFFGLSGWDTHANQGKEKGPLASSLLSLKSGLLELYSGLQETWNDTVIVVMSEFGRTVKENGTKGTDHGHGNVMWLLGGSVAGKKIYGTWPTLQADKLYQNRDLAITTDFRSVLCEVINHQYNLNSQQLSRIFPNFLSPQQPLGLFK